MSWADPIPVVHDEPLDRLVIEEVVQLLGHDPRTVAAVFIEARSAGGDVARVIERSTADPSMLVEHRHAIL